MHTLKELKRLIRDAEKIEKDLMEQYAVDEENTEIIKKYNEITGAVDKAYTIIESKL